MLALSAHLPTYIARADYVIIITFEFRVGTGVGYIARAGHVIIFTFVRRVGAGGGYIARAGYVIIFTFVRRVGAGVGYIAQAGYVIISATLPRRRSRGLLHCPGRLRDHFCHAAAHRRRCCLHCPGRLRDHFCMRRGVGAGEAYIAQAGYIGMQECIRLVINSHITNMSAVIQDRTVTDSVAYGPVR